MKVLIIEDEKAAVRRLKSLLSEIDLQITVIGTEDTVKSTIHWFENNDLPDLAFFDIQLADGNSFEIFEKIQIDCPVIFTTAFDQYALKAFEVNSIDYLLKPVDSEKLRRALHKYKKLIGSNKPPALSPEIIRSTLDLLNGNRYKERFVVKYGDHIKSVPASDITFFKSESKATFIHLPDGKRYLIDFTMDQVVNMVDPEQFFRINRRYIVNIHSLKDIIAYSNSRLRLILQSIDDPDMIVAREKVGDFKEWLDR